MKLLAVVVECSMGGEEYFGACWAGMCAAGVDARSGAIAVID